MVSFASNVNQSDNLTRESTRHLLQLISQNKYGDNNSEHNGSDWPKNVPGIISVTNEKNAVRHIIEHINSNIVPVLSAASAIDTGITGSNDVKCVKRAIFLGHCDTIKRSELVYWQGIVGCMTQYLKELDCLIDTAT